MKAGHQQRKTTAANRRKIEQNVISKFLIRLQPHTVFAKNMSFKMKIELLNETLVHLGLRNQWKRDRRSERESA